MKEIEVEGTLSSITASLTEVAVNLKLYGLEVSLLMVINYSLVFSGKVLLLVLYITNKKCFKNLKDVIPTNRILIKIHMSG